MALAFTHRRIVSSLSWPFRTLSTTLSSPGLNHLPGASTVIKHYSWAYVWPRAVRFWDRDICVAMILWFYHKKLQKEVRKELAPGMKVLQSSNVYGTYVQNLARYLGPLGKLDMIDVMPIQVERAKIKLAAYPNASARIADAASPGGDPPYDAAVSYFLQHEVSEKQRTEIVNALLRHVRPDCGKVRTYECLLDL